jgi:hypothetical protein
MSEWIDAARALPEQSQEVLITGFERCRGEVTKRRFKVVATHMDGVFYNGETGDDYYPPTHWMAIPEIKS